MKALVTGGAGFIGSHIVDALVDAGHSVCVVDNLWVKGGGKVENVNGVARFYETDIRDAVSLFDVFEAERPDIIYHEAAQHSVKISTQDPSLDAQVNILGLLNVLHACVAFDAKKIVFASSGAIHGPVKAMPIDEDTPQCPSCPYGITKMATEHYLRYWNEQHGLKYTVFRYANVYGPRQDATGEAGVIAIFTKRMIRGETITIKWDGEQTRDFVYVGDIAAANLMALSSGENETYCLGSGIGTSINSVYKKLATLTGVTMEPDRAPKTPGDQRHSRMDAGKARAELGWAPSIALAVGLQKTLDYFKSQWVERRGVKDAYI
jgi:UDP-glucose 4-epimerase